MKGFTFEGHVTCRCACGQTLVVEVEQVAVALLEATAGDLAQDSGWGDAETCPSCHDRNERNVAEVNKADAARMEEALGR